MCNFAVELFDRVRINGKIKFYKVLRDGEAQIDSFFEEICANKQHESELRNILAVMDYVAETNAKLPANKVNSIKDKGKEIAIEFKSKQLRIYCFMKDPNVFVVLGGYKKDQSRDVKALIRLLKGDKAFVEHLEQLI